MKKFFKFVGIFFVGILVLGILGSIFGDTESNSGGQKVSTVEQDKKAQEAKKKAEQEKAKKQEAERKAKQDAEQTQSAKEQLILEVLKTSFKKSGTVSFDKEHKNYIITSTDPNFAKAIVSVYAGVMDDREWNLLVDSHIGVSKKIEEGVGSGYTLSLANPSNPDKFILVILDGVVIYDLMKDK